MSKHGVICPTILNRYILILSLILVFSNFINERLYKSFILSSPSLLIDSSINSNDSILLIGATHCNAIQVAKYLISDKNIAPSSIIGIDNDYYDTFNRQNELMMTSIFGVCVIRSNLCNQNILLSILKSNDISLIIPLSEDNNTKCIRHTLQKYHFKIKIEETFYVNSINNNCKNQNDDINITHKHNLLISAFYLNKQDPQQWYIGIDYQRQKNNITFCMDYMKNWYNTFMVAMNNDLSNTDMIIIHDGVPVELIRHYKYVQFIQYDDKYNNISRPSPNDIRYYHFKRYINNKNNKNKYKYFITTDLRDVRFGKINPFKYYYSNHNHITDILVGVERSIYSIEWVNNNLNSCYKGLEFERTMKYFHNQMNIAVNPGIIATNIEIMDVILEEMIHLFSSSAKNTDCNFVVWSISLYIKCIFYKTCNIIDDTRFYSPFKQYMDPKFNNYVIYHK